MSSSGANSNRKPKLGIIGGSGFYELPGLTEVERVKPRTKYGYPSDEITVGLYQDKPVAFLPRHGEKHQLPPHKVPYKANIAALKGLGVEKILATCIAGSLKEEIPPGSFVVIDQFVNLTWGRDDYFEADRSFVYLPMAQPYCSHLSRLVGTLGRQMGIPVRMGGTVVVIQGPRFSTLAESRWFIRNGWDLVNMTQYPECYFARELGICYAACAAITDYDPGVGGLFFGKNPKKGRFPNPIRPHQRRFLPLADTERNFG